MLLLRRPTILASLPALTSSFLSITTAGKLVLPRPITTLPKHSFHTCQQTPLKMADTISTPSSSAESRERELLGFFKNISTFMPPAVLLENSRRVTEKLAAQMLDQIDLNKDTTTPFKLFDNACGIGATNFELYRRVQREVLKESKVLCGDFSEGAIDIAKKVAEVEGWTGETEVRVVDAQNTGLPSGHFTHVTTNLGFHVVPDSKAALDEAVRILAPNGRLAFTTPHHIPGWALEVQDAFRSFPFEAPFSFSVQTTTYGDWGNPNWIRRELEHRKGLQDVRVQLFSFLSHVDGPDYFLEYFGAMVDWIVKSNWDEETRAKHPREEYRRLLRDHLVDKYGNEGRGWDVSWVMVVASGRVPLNAA